MELSRVLKAIVAIGTGATLLGATVLSALAAADLTTYPAPFVSDGKYDALIVVGTNAKAEDILGSIDIVASLQAVNTETTMVPGSTSSTTVTGDTFKLDTGSDNLGMLENLDAVGITTLTDIQMKALAGGSLTNAKGTSTYDETLSVASDANVTFTVNPADSTDIPDWYLVFYNGGQVYQYEAAFTPALQSDIASSEHQDFEDATLTLLGSEYTIIDADHTNETNWQIDLMGGAVKDVIGIGETKTYSIGDKDYEVTLTFVDSSNAKFIVNGKSTKLIASGGTEVLADGTEMGVKELLYQNYAGGVQSVEFYLGAKKLRLKDTNVAASGTGGQAIIVGSNTVSDVTAEMAGSSTGTESSLNTITLTWTADDDFYVPKDGRLSALADDGQMFLNFDIEFKGIEEDSKKDTIDLSPRGDDEYDLDFTNKAGNLLSVPLFDVDSTTIAYGNENDALNVMEWVVNSTVDPAATPAARRIDKDEYFIVSDGSSKNTYLLRYKNLDITDGKMEFEEMGIGQSVVVSYSFTNGYTAAADIDLGGNSYDVYILNSSASPANDDPVLVDLDRSGALVNDTVPQWFTKNGGKIEVNNTGVGTFNLTTGSLNDESTAQIHIFNVNAPSADHIDVSSVGGGFSLQANGDTDDSLDYAKWGTRAYLTGVNSGPDKLNLIWPSKQTKVLVYYTSGETTTTTGASTYEKVVPIGVGTAVLDTEVEDFSAQNLIVVGGPCVNTAAAELLGSSAECAAGFEDGKAMVKLFERANGKVALLVAGFTGLDTRRAARALANYGDYGFSGEEVTVSGGNLTDITVTVVS